MRHIASIARGTIVFLFFKYGKLSHHQTEVVFPKSGVRPCVSLNEEIDASAIISGVKKALKKKKGP